MENALICEKESSIFWKYLIPSMLSMLAVSAYSFVDTFVVGQGIGANAVAAMGVGTPIISLLYALGFLFGSGGAVVYVIAKGRGRIEEANQIFSISFLVSVFLWIVFASFGNIWIHEVADFLGATPGNHALAVEYLRWVISLSGVLILDLVMNNFIRNEGYPNVSMIATVVGTSLNIILDFVFVLVFHWGMSGAASATCIASLVSVFINCSYAIAKKTNLIPKLKLRAIRHLKTIIPIGSGACVLEGAIAIISIVFLNYSGKHFGDDGVSAFSVLMTLNVVVYSLINGVAQAMQPLISANYAIRAGKRMRNFVKYSLLASLILGAVFCLAGIVFHDILAGLFVSDSETVLNLASHGVQIVSLSFFFMSVSIVLGIYFQSEAKPIQAIIILLGRSAVFPIVMLFLLTPFFGKESLWLAIPIGEFLAMIMSVAMYWKEIKQPSVEL